MPQPIEIADLRRVGLRRGKAQIGVLVVHRGDLPVGRRPAAATVVAAAARYALDRDRHLEVERGVALAHRQDREPRLGARLHARPHFQRRPQAGPRLPCGAASRFHAFEHPLVEAVSRASRSSRCAGSSAPASTSAVGSSRATMSNAAEPPAVRMIARLPKRPSRSQATRDALARALINPPTTRASCAVSPVSCSPS